ncbi:SDR family oxidoreductase [Rosettibacter firmus]|uniref:SDR family oxidoreductase n=1 Tax=Rosettibacter firmus TaxID=3111522 RepID=UPI00336BEB99
MEKILLLFGSSGHLGKTAISYFLNQDYNKYYFFTRKPLDISPAENVNIIFVEDLSIEKNVADAFSKININNNSLLFLFNTIGTYYGGKRIEDTPYEEWKSLLDINLNSSFFIAKYFVKLVKEAKGGSICFTSAYSAFYNEPNIAAYGVSKSALNYLVKSLSIEGKEINMSANAVAPYIIDTPENREWMKDKSKLIPALKICEVVQKIFDEWKILTGNIISFFEFIEN